MGELRKAFLSPRFTPRDPLIARTVASNDPRSAFPPETPRASRCLAGKLSAARLWEAETFAGVGVPAG